MNEEEYNEYYIDIFDDDEEYNKRKEKFSSPEARRERIEKILSSKERYEHLMFYFDHHKEQFYEALKRHGVLQDVIKENYDILLSCTIRYD